ncbi:MAG: tetratricopeptide repeat protein [Candidatus Eisenbacteria bacterium]|nr:tetratricopeptide repeat protein [Candidatus Eisenbacteria bacterium]
MLISMLSFLLATLLGVASPAAAPRALADHANSAPTAADEFRSGLMHFARGEYRQAADAFGRAGARLEPARKPEAHYWAGLSWLGAGDAVQARSAFENVIASAASRLPFAELGLACAWELAHRPDRAVETLSVLIRTDAGEAMPAALARYATLAAAEGQLDAAAHARERLLREWPASMEAAALRLSSAGAPLGTPGEGSPRGVAPAAASHAASLSAP